MHFVARFGNFNLEIKRSQYLISGLPNLRRPQQGKKLQCNEFIFWTCDNASENYGHLHIITRLGCSWIFHFFHFS
jgi:hypothetical protein